MLREVLLVNCLWKASCEIHQNYHYYITRFSILTALGTGDPVKAAAPVASTAKMASFILIF